MNQPIKKKTVSLLFSVFVCMAISVYAQSSKVFPLALSQNQRYLIDQQQKPFLIKEFSAWGLIQALSEKDDIDGLYVWTESVMFEKGPQYRSAIQQYKKGKMIIQLDQSYEHDVPHYADNENYQWIRRKNYGGLLSGCAGTSFSAGQIDNQCYSFKNWKPLMNTQGMREVAYCLRLFDALPWHKLVPDVSNEIILTDRLSEFGSRDFVCAARASDGSFYVMYLPKGQPFEVNVKKISGKPMRMHWYNPRTGAVLRIGVADTKERFGVAPPSEEDWVLVFDNDPTFKMPNKF